VGQNTRIADLFLKYLKKVYRRSQKLRNIFRADVLSDGSFSAGACDTAWNKRRLRVFENL